MLCSATFSVSNPSRTASEHLKRGAFPNFAVPLATASLPAAAATRPAHARAPPRLAVLPATAPLGPRPLLPLDQQPAPLGPCVLPALLRLTAAALATVAGR